MNTPSGCQAARVAINAALTIRVDPRFRSSIARDPSIQPIRSLSSLSLKAVQLTCVCKGTEVTEIRFRVLAINSKLLTSTDTAPKN